MAVRQAGPSDAEEIARIHVSSWQAAYRGILPDHTLDNLSVNRSEEHWKKQLRENDAHILVYEREDSILGFIKFGSSRDEDADEEEVGEIYSVYLDPGEYRKGYGSKLTSAGLKVLGEEGYSEITLWVLKENDQARGFYEAMGFEPDGSEKVETRRDGTKLHEIRYRLILAS